MTKKKEKEILEKFNVEIMEVFHKYRVLKGRSSSMLLNGIGLNQILDEAKNNIMEKNNG